jgi:hypothetical protein
MNAEYREVLQTIAPGYPVQAAISRLNEARASVSINALTGGRSRCIRRITKLQGFSASGRNVRPIESAEASVPILTLERHGYASSAALGSLSARRMRDGLFHASPSTYTFATTKPVPQIQTGG